MKKIVYGSLSVLTAICTVFVAAKAEVFSENRTGGATSEVVESSDINGLLEPDSLGNLGSPLAGDQALSLDTDVADADAKALGSASLAENALSGQSAVKATPETALSQGKIAKRVPVSGASTSSAFSAVPGSQSASSVAPTTSSASSATSAFVPTTSPITSAPVTGLQSQPATSQTLISPVPGPQPSASQVIDAESSEAVSPSVTPIAQATPATVPTVPAGNSTLPGPGISPASSEAGIEAESDAMESDVELETGADAEMAGPETENSVEIGQPAPAGDNPFGTTSSPATGDTLDTTTEPEGPGVEAEDMDAEDAEMDPAMDSEIESDAESLDTGAEDLGTPGASDLEGADDLGAEDTLDAEPEGAPAGATPAPFGTPSAPGGTSVPGTVPGVEAAPDSTDDAMDADGEGADAELDQPALEAEPDMAPDAGFGEEPDMAPDAEFGDDADTEVSPEADFEEDADLEEDADFEEEPVPAAPSGSPTLETPFPSSPAPASPTPSSPLPSAPSQSTPLPEGPANGSSEPLSPIEEEVAPDEVPTSGSESFGAGDRLIGEGFSPFQLSYLAIGGGLEGIPGGNMLLAAYEAGDVSAADIVDAGASTNRLGTDADNQDDYTAGVDRFLELLSREND